MEITWKWAWFPHDFHFCVFCLLFLLHFPPSYSGDFHFARWKTQWFPYDFHLRKWKWVSFPLTNEQFPLFSTTKSGNSFLISTLRWTIYNSNMELLQKLVHQSGNNMVIRAIKWKACGNERSKWESHSISIFRSN